MIAALIVWLFLLFAPHHHPAPCAGLTGLPRLECLEGHNPPPIYPHTRPV